MKPSAAVQPTPTAPPEPVVDRFGRQLRYLRVSVTDYCNLSCHYCNPVKGCGATHPHKLSWEDLDFLVEVAIADLGVEAIRITGGEPTVRPGLAEWIAGLQRHATLRDVAMTTNGIVLDRMAPALAAAGLRRVNISLDTFDADRYAMVTRGGSLERCMAGIEMARAHFQRVKLNAVMLRGFNVPNELNAYVEFSHRTGIEVRFIELMPIFGAKSYFEKNFIGVEEAMEALNGAGFTLEPEGDGPAEGNATGYGPATTWRVAGSNARLGFISQISNTKCLSCNKLRITSDGALKPCLLSPDEQDLAPLLQTRQREEIAFAMARQFLDRAERYDAEIARTDPFSRGMQAIGG